MQNKTVTKRSGKVVKIDMNRVEAMVDFGMRFAGLEPAVLLHKLDIAFYDKIKTSEIQKAIIHEAKLFIQEGNPTNNKWALAVGRFEMAELHGEIHKNTALKQKDFVEGFKKLYDMGIYKVPHTDEILEYASGLLDLEVDFTVPTQSVVSLKNTYIVKADGVFIEYPQWANLADAIFAARGNKDKIKEYYLVLANGETSSSTPVKKNLRLGGNTASCFSIMTQDSLTEIMGSVSDAADISKAGGGLAVYLGKIRPEGSTIQHVKGAATHINKWVKFFDVVASTVDQLGSRKGAITVSLDWFHLDFMEFMQVGVEDGGSIRQKSFDIIPQFLLNNLLLKKVKTKESVFLLNVYDVKSQLGIDLTELVGDAWEVGYYTALQHLDVIAHKEVNAYDLWVEAWEAYFKVGKINITNKDNINMSNYLRAHYKAQTLNLCVTGDTKILTKELGSVEIKDVAGQELSCWNGEEWSKTKLFKTHDSYNKIYNVKVRFDEFTVANIQASDYHKWYNAVGEMFRTIELSVGMHLEGHINPEDTTEYIEGGVVESVVLLNHSQELFCGYEPKRNKLIFNGQLTGNCVESYSINTEKYDHTCNLMSLNLGKLVINTEEDETEKVRRVVRTTVDMLNDIIDISTFPTEKTKASARDLRNTGIGIVGGADWLAYKSIPYNKKGLDELERVMEMISYFAYQRSIELAKIHGAYPLFKEADYSLMFGKTPEELNRISKNGFDWVALQKDILKYGIYNFLLVSPAPNASTAVVMGVSPNFLPVTSHCHFKDMQSITPVIVPPFVDEKFAYYKTRGSFDGVFFLELTAAIQRWTDTGVSNEIGVNPDLFEMVAFSDKVIELMLKGELKAVYYMAETTCLTCAN